MLIYILIISFLLNFNLPWQTKEPDIKKNLESLKNGKLSEVKNELQKMKSEHPSNLGVKYLQAILTESGDGSIKIYSELALKDKKNEWVRNSIIKLYQYNLLIGNSVNANKFKKEITSFDSDYFDTPIKSSGLFTIQVGAFSSSEKAKNLADQIKNMNYKSELIKRKTEKKTLYIVTIGNFSKKSEAEKAQKKIEDELDIASIIVIK